jgi:hypothetical protein
MYIFAKKWGQFFVLFADHHSHDHTHDPGVSSVSIVCEGNLDLEKVSTCNLSA